MTTRSTGTSSDGGTVAAGTSGAGQPAPSTIAASAHPCGSKSSIGEIGDVTSRQFGMHVSIAGC